MKERSGSLTLVTMRLEGQSSGLHGLLFRLWERATTVAAGWSRRTPSPLLLASSRRGSRQINDIRFDPTGQWLLTTDFNGVTLWPLARSYPTVSKSQSPGKHLLMGHRHGA